MEKSLADTLTELYEVIEKRKSEKVEGSYTCYLFDRGINKILKKCGEECSEVIIAAKDLSSETESDKRDQLLLNFENEVGDLFYHLLVLLVGLDVGMDDINKVLRERRKS